jgi:hypothetical protein
MGLYGKACAVVAGAGALATIGMAGGAHARPQCDAGWRFEHPRRVDRKLVVFDRERDENRTGRTAMATFTARHGGTVSYSIAGDFGAGAEASLFDVIKVSIQSNLHVDVRRELHAEVGNSISVKVPPNRAVTGRYGVFKLVVRGHLFYLTRTCQRQHNHPRTRVRLPNQVGWRINQHRIHRH